MTNTEIMLLAVHRSPLVRLEDICDRYFGIAYDTARSKAALNQLPVPTWRLIDSQKAPLMVRLSDLAAHIDSTAEAAVESHDNSRI